MSENNELKKLEFIDWRYSAAIVGLVKYFNFNNDEFEKITFKKNFDSIEYNPNDIYLERYLAFAENEFGTDFLHKSIEDILYNEAFNDEQIKIVNDKLAGNTILKKCFNKLKFDGKNKDQILDIIKQNREDIIKETFKNKKNMYANFCNSNLFFKDTQPHCRLIGYNIDEGRKSKSIGYKFNKNSIVSNDFLEFDFIPFAFTNTYESIFINNNFALKELIESNNIIKKYIDDEKESKESKAGIKSKIILFRNIMESSDYLNHDVEVIIKNRNNSYYESLFIRKSAIKILREIKNIKLFSINIKVTEDYYISDQDKLIDNILNNLVIDELIELLLKEDIKVYNYGNVISRLIEINIKIKGVKELTSDMKSAYGCAKRVSEKFVKENKSNKIKSYRQKLISSIIFEDYSRVCDILLQLSAYSDINFDFAYCLFEDFEKNKDVAYTFINALETEKNKQEEK